MGDSAGTKASKSVGGGAMAGAADSQKNYDKELRQFKENQVLQDLGYTTKNGNVYSNTGQVAGSGWSGSRAVDVVRGKGDQLEFGGLGEGQRGTRSPKEIRQLSTITGLPIEDIRSQAENVSEIYGRPAEVRLSVGRDGQPSAYGATAPNFSEFVGDLNRGIFGGTYMSRMRGEPNPADYQGIVAPMTNLVMPGGFLRTMIPNVYQEGKEFLSQPIDYTKNLFSGIFSPSATQAAEEVNPEVQRYLDIFQNYR